MTTAADLYQRALGTLGLSFPDGLVGLTNETGALAALNGGLQDLSTKHNWQFAYEEEIIQTSPGKHAYDPPCDWLQTSMLIGLDGHFELQPRQRREHFLFPAPDRPIWYDTSGDKILLAPVPDGTYQILHGYYKRLPVIRRDTDSYETLQEQLDEEQINVPAPYDELAVLYIARRLTLLEKDREHYQMVNDQLNDYIRTISDNRMRQTRPGRVSTRKDVRY